MLAHLRGQLGQGGAGHVQRTRVAGHGIAIDALAVQLRGMLGHRQHRQRVLRGVEGLGIGLHVRRVEAFEARVIDHRQHAMRAQAGLDRVEQQQAAVGTGQFAGNGIERRRHRTPRIAFAHHRFQEHRLDEPLVACGVLEHLAQAGFVVRRHGDHRVLTAVAGQVLHVALAAGIGIQGRAIGTAMEAALDHHALDRSASVARTRVGLQLGVDVGDARGQANRFGTGIQAHETGERAAATAVADLGAQGGDETLLRQAGVMMLAITCGRAIASNTASGACPKPSMP